MANEAVDRKIPTPQPRPALSLVGAPRVLSLDNYECFIGPSTHIAELKEFISIQASQRQPALLIGERGLLWIVLRQIAYEYVGIETYHLPAPRLAMIRRISSTDSGVGGLGTIPLSVRTSSVAGTKANCPLASSMNSTRSPVSTPSF